MSSQSKTASDETMPGPNYNTRTQRGSLREFRVSKRRPDREKMPRHHAAIISQIQGRTSRAGRHTGRGCLTHTGTVAAPATRFDGQEVAAGSRTPPPWTQAAPMQGFAPPFGGSPYALAIRDRCRKAKYKIHHSSLWSAPRNEHSVQQSQPRSEQRRRGRNGLTVPTGGMVACCSDGTRFSSMGDGHQFRSDRTKRHTPYLLAEYHRRSSGSGALCVDCPSPLSDVIATSVARRLTAQRPTILTKPNSFWIIAALPRRDDWIRPILPHHQTARIVLRLSRRS